MADQIKILSMGVIFEAITEGVSDKEENRIDKLLAQIETQEDFNKMFFYADKEQHQYFYLESQESAIKAYLFKQVDISKAENSRNAEWSFRTLGDELLGNKNGKDIEINTCFGTMTIIEDEFIDGLLEFLTDEEINRLINAADFKEEMKIIKKECLEYLIDMHIDCIKDELRTYQFEYFA